MARRVDTVGLREERKGVGERERGREEEREEGRDRERENVYKCICVGVIMCV